MTKIKNSLIRNIKIELGSKSGSFELKLQKKYQLKHYNLSKLKNWTFNVNITSLNSNFIKLKVSSIKFCEIGYVKMIYFLNWNFIKKLNIL